MPQQATANADELFAPKGRTAPSSGVGADTLFGQAPVPGKAPVQAPATQQPPVTQLPPTAKPPIDMGAVQRRAEEIVKTKSEKSSTLTKEEQRSPFWSGVQEQFGLDPDKIHAQKHYVLEGAKELLRGMDKFITSVAKDPQHVVDPFSTLAKGLEFHIKGHDPFGLGGKITPIDHIVNGLKNNDEHETALGAGGFLATLGQLYGGGRSRGVVSKVGALPDAFPAEKVLAATNDTLQKTADTTKTQIKGALKQVGNAVGTDVKNIADADRQAIQGALARGSFTKNGIANTIVGHVVSTRAGSTPLVGTNAVLKALKRYGNDLTWEDVKDIRQVVDHARQSASGKDVAVLGASYADLTKMLAKRAEQLGKGDTFERYTENTAKLSKLREGVLSKLESADTGLKFYNELAKAQNRPLLNDLFELLGPHSSLSIKLVDDIVKSHKPLATLAGAADKNTNFLAGRLQALSRHPIAAGTTGLATMSLPHGYIISLLTMGKIGELMDRIDAAEALRNIQRQTAPPVATAGAVAPGGGGVPSAPPPPPVTGPTHPVTGPPAAPTTASPVAPPTPTPVAPATPTSTAASRVVESMKQYHEAPPSEVGLPAERHAELEARMGRTLSQNEAIDIDRTELERRSAGGEGVPKAPAKAAKTTPKAYEEFGVKLNPGDWKTPEDVVSAKNAAKQQVTEAVNKRAIELERHFKAGMISADTVKDTVKDLTVRMNKAIASIDRVKSKSIGRVGRDRIRKATTAPKIFSASEELDDTSGKTGVSREVQEASSTTGGMDITEAGIEIDQWDRAYKAIGKSKDYKNIVTKWEDSEFEGDYVELARRLREGFEKHKQ